MSFDKLPLEERKRAVKAAMTGPSLMIAIGRGAERGRAAAAAAGAGEVVDRKRGRVTRISVDGEDKYASISVEHPELRREEKKDAGANGEAVASPSYTPSSTLCVPREDARQFSVGDEVEIVLRRAGGASAATDDDAGDDGAGDEE